MLYFTEIRHRKVITEDGVLVGKLDDLVFDFRDVPLITKLLVKADQAEIKHLYIPTNFVVSIGDHIIINKSYKTNNLSSNELFVMKNLIDKQIIDIEGHKVVRVNDVFLLRRDNDKLSIVGVDVSLLGIMRWLGLEAPIKTFFGFFGKRIESHILPWPRIQPLELSEGKVLLNVNQDKLENILPEDLADYLEVTNMDNIIQTINLLEVDFAAEVIAELNLNYQTLLFKKISMEKGTQILAQMDPDEAVDVLMSFTEKRRQEILTALDKVTRDKLQELIEFSRTEVGEFMTTEFLTVTPHDTAQSVIEKIKKETEELSSLDYVYVINASQQLIGVFNLHELILQPGLDPVRKFMLENPVQVYLHTPLSVLQRKLIKYKITALPVVDKFKKMIGVVTFDDIGEFFMDKALKKISL